MANRKNNTPTKSSTPSKKVDYLAEENHKWLYAIVTIVLGISLIEPFFLGPYMSQDMLSKLSNIQVALAAIIISLIVRKTQRVYWLTSLTYEETVKLSKRIRYTLAEAIARITVTHMIILILYSVIAGIFDVPRIADLIVFAVVVMLNVGSNMVAVNNIAKLEAIEKKGKKGKKRK